MRTRAGKKAWNFERRLEEGKGKAIARKYLEEMKEKWRKRKKEGN